MFQVDAEVLDDFVDSFAGHKPVDEAQEAKLEMPSDDCETKITADFVEETLIQPIQKQDSLNTGVSYLFQKECLSPLKSFRMLQGIE